MGIPQRSAVDSGRGWHRRTPHISCDVRGGDHGVAGRAAAPAAVRNRATADPGGGIVIARVGLSKAILVRPWDSRGRRRACDLGLTAPATPDRPSGWPDRVSLGT